MDRTQADPNAASFGNRGRTQVVNIGAMRGTPMELQPGEDVWLRNPDDGRKLTISYNGKAIIWMPGEEKGPYNAMFAEWLVNKSVDLSLIHI